MICQLIYNNRYDVLFLLFKNNRFSNLNILNRHSGEVNHRDLVFARTSESWIGNYGPQFNQTIICDQFLVIGGTNLPVACVVSNTQQAGH